MFYSYVNGLIFFSIALITSCPLFCDRNMSNLNKLNFTTLEVSGRNYLKWVQDVKLNLIAKNLCPPIEDEIDNLVGEAEKAIAMIFIRRHIHVALQNEYVAEDDPQALWVILADHFDHQNDIF